MQSESNKTKSNIDPCVGTRTFLDFGEATSSVNNK